MQMRSHDPAELQELARAFIDAVAPADAAIVVTLSGDLGAGKTTFAQGVARALGVVETVSSPTFVIEKVYALSAQRWNRLVHIDAYRLNSSHELMVLGWNELIADPKNIIVLEWPERVSDLIPKHAVQIRFDIKNEERIITINDEEN